ncbi:hypothetical protein K470DRAFT_256042 [Piedraia hortae CBS 480.64]|uniref:Uncharacterized protein n=1 Tax=Piedraia hortae CBS 480.64 TaxID=1314780 RepID=A0A6A7C5Z8_9PEZI|nr:hypothetical protein K470DRAFT_256042 [Piedraia hortae CBS 480.64]
MDNFKYTYRQLLRNSKTGVPLHPLSITQPTGSEQSNIEAGITYQNYAEHEPRDCQSPDWGIEERQQVLGNVVHEEKQDVYKLVLSVLTCMLILVLIFLFLIIVGWVLIKYLTWAMDQNVWKCKSVQ